MGKLNLQGVGIHYECEGRGLPLLFFHGLGGELAQSREMLKRIGGVRKIMMDVRGHGASDAGRAKDLHFGQLARDAAALADRLDIRRFVAGGISMGAAIAIRLALDFPARVAGLVLIRPAWLNIPYPVNLNEHVQIGALLARRRPEEAKRIFTADKAYRALAKNAPATARSLLGLLDSGGKRAALLVRMPAAVPFDNPADLDKIRAATLVLGTDDDPAHPLSMAREIASRIHGSRLAVVASKNKNTARYFTECAREMNVFLKGITT